MSNLYLTLHVLTALISISGFIFRGILHFRSSPLLTKKWIKIAPHVNDTLLIVSAILLLKQSNWVLLEAPWLQAKIVGLLLYIALGLIAFRFGKSRRVRLLAWIEAIMVFAYIVSVAITKNPLIIFSA